MTVKKKYILFSVLVIIATAFFYAYKQYTGKPADLSGAKVSVKIRSADLVNEFIADEDAANKKYLGKIIQVAGPVAEIDNEQDTAVTVLLGLKDELHKISCRLDRRHLDDIKKCIPGNIVAVKGSCTGFLLDVELNRCVISNDQ